MRLNQHQYIQLNNYLQQNMTLEIFGHRHDMYMFEALVSLRQDGDYDFHYEWGIEQINSIIQSLQDVLEQENIITIYIINNQGERQIFYAEQRQPFRLPRMPMDFDDNQD